jgi:hypothetical protein
MDAEPLIVKAENSQLLELSEPHLNRLETLTAVWDATEALVSPDLLTRITGLKRLLESNAAQQFPLVAYMLATRIVEPDIELRARIVSAIAEVISTGESGIRNGGVFQTISAYLAGLRTRQIFALLQVVEFDRSKEESTAELLSYCSFAGEHLGQILANRQVSLSIRRQAAKFIGRIGYLDALPALERMVSRMEDRREEEDSPLYPALQEAIQLLRSP